MGEYIKVDGQEVKIGTCEDMYYTRFDQLKQAIVSGIATTDASVNGENPSNYINEKYGWRYRFPFPEEDGTKIGHYDIYNKGYIIPVDMEYMLTVDHEDICVSTACKGGYNVNHYIKCPGSKDWIRTCSSRGTSAPLELIQQKQVDGKLWIVCRCGWCGAAFRLPKEDALKLCQYLSDSDYDKEIKKRIMQGYQ